MKKKTISDHVVMRNIKYVRAASKKKGAICFSHLYSRCENILFEILQGKLDLGRFPHHISIKETSNIHTLSMAVVYILSLIFMLQTVFHQLSYQFFVEYCYLIVVSLIKNMKNIPYFPYIYYTKSHLVQNQLSKLKK